VVVEVVAAISEVHDASILMVAVYEVGELVCVESSFDKKWEAEGENPLLVWANWDIAPEKLCIRSFFMVT
jgi:hypothetical protein